MHYDLLYYIYLKSFSHCEDTDILIGMQKRIIIDVREPFEFASGHVPDAINIPPRELMDGSPKLASIPKDTELILYCRSGSRSRIAAMILTQQGYTNIINGINQDYVTTHYVS